MGWTSAYQNRDRRAIKDNRLGVALTLTPLSDAFSPGTTRRANAAHPLYRPIPFPIFHSPFPLEQYPSHSRQEGNGGRAEGRRSGPRPEPVAVVHVAWGGAAGAPSGASARADGGGYVAWGASGPGLPPWSRSGTVSSMKAAENRRRQRNHCRSPGGALSPLTACATTGLLWKGHVGRGGAAPLTLSCSAGQGEHVRPIFSQFVVDYPIEWS